MNININALSLLLSGLIFTPTINAAPLWFEVEVILFERIGEQSKEKFVDTIKQYKIDNALHLVDDAVYGTLLPCPTLTQFERFSIISQQIHEKDVSIDPINDIEQVITSSTQVQTLPTSAEEKTSNSNEVINTIVECITPNDELLRKAYDIRASRLLNISANNSTADSSAQIDSLSEQLTTTDFITNDFNDNQINTIQQGQESIIERPETLDYDSNTFIAYPMEFSFNGIDYRSVQNPIIPSKVPLKIINKAVDGQVHTPEVPYLLDNEHLQMNKLVQKLRWQKTSTPLLHLGWRQPMLARHLSIPIHLFAGKDFSEQFDQQGNDKAVIQNNDILQSNNSEINQQSSSLEQSKSNLNDAAPNISISDIVAELESQQILEDSAKLWQLDGLLNIYLNHYLFIETDFDFRKVEPVKVTVEENEPKSDESNNQPISLLSRSKIDNHLPGLETKITYVNQLTSHPMKQHRRVRSKEVHYFDHPSMGMIIQIRRFEILEPIESNLIDSP